MLEVCLLGTGGMMPLPYRWLTSLMVRYNGKSILIDCGEGTQIAMKEKGWSPKPIDVICFTHFHADHISGLPGMLLTMGNAERTEPLTVIGPKGLTRTVNALRVIAPELPFEIRCIEFEENEQTLCFDGLRIEAFRSIIMLSAMDTVFRLTVQASSSWIRRKRLELSGATGTSCRKVRHWSWMGKSIRRIWSWEKPERV